MPFCQKCGLKLNSDKCPNCTTNVEQSKYQANANDAPNILFAIIGFLFPIIGFLIFFLCTATTPFAARSAVRGAIVNYVVVSILTIFAIFALFTLLSTVDFETLLEELLNTSKIFI